ncbi:MAG TPA: aldehyde-activating protein [Polyangia bacterium]
MILAGGCHCSGVAVELETPHAPEQLPQRECQCSFCRRHGARNTVDPDGRVRIVAAPGALSRYRFALGTADFLFCARCGVYVGCVIDDAFATLNVRVLDDAERFTQHASPKVWDGETAEERRARRRATWTPASVEERK